MQQISRPSADAARVVFLVNFLAPNLVEVFREVQRRVGRLHILVSVPVEANRQWTPDYADLQVIEQRTWTSRRVVEHPGGYSEELFVHFPFDTLSQLKALQPHCIVSLEMGTRSLMSSLYRHAWRRDCRHVLAVYASERSEAGRGAARRWLRRQLLSAADVITYNGPSCRRYLLSQGADEGRLLPWNYAADPHKAYRGPLDSLDADALQLLTVSQLIPRKGVLSAAGTLCQWARSHADREIQWAIAGTGPEQSAIERLNLPSNLTVELLGHQDPAQLRELYQKYPVNLFPTLGDEWGLVVDEALASGQIVLGSVYSQAVETLVQDGKNGWSFNPEQHTSLLRALDRLATLGASELDNMRASARHSVADRTHLQSAEQFVQAVTHALS